MFSHRLYLWRSEFFYRVRVREKFFSNLSSCRCIHCGSSVSQVELRTTSRFKLLGPFKLQHSVWHHYADWVSISLKTAAAVTSPPEGAAGWKNCRTADRFCFDWSWFQPSATPCVLRFLSFKFDFKMRLLECVLALCSLLRWFFKKETGESQMQEGGEREKNAKQKTTWGQKRRRERQMERMKRGERERRASGRQKEGDRYGSRERTVRGRIKVRKIKEKQREGIRDKEE